MTNHKREMVITNEPDKWKFFYMAFWSSLISVAQNAESGIRVLLTADPPWSNVQMGVTVILACEVAGSDPSSQWEYSWKAIREAEETTLLQSSGEGDRTIIFTLSDVTETDSAEYCCEVKAGNHSATSAAHAVNVHALATLAIVPNWKTVHIAEQVTLTCKIHSNLTDWGYLWYKNGREIPIEEDTYIINSSIVSDSGQYSCWGKRKINPKYTASSNMVSLVISARPVAVLTLETPWTGIFRTDSLILRCSVEGNFTGWNYTWYRDGQLLAPQSSGDTLTLAPSNDSDSSEYRCRGNRTGHPSYTDISEGCVPADKISRIVENLARLAVGAAILLFLSIIVNEGFWRKVRKIRRCDV
ncbi:hypothetical protein GJAV_G00171520 [Gymnothorax javanicus]|nr:hypothetical protein GJAV_G00171520 [Gymnothorax javanicus]